MKNLFLFLYIFLFSQVSIAETLEVEKQILSIVSSEAKKICHTCKVDVKIFNKKVLDEIAVPDAIVADNWKGQTNLVLKTGSKNTIVTVDIRWFDKVVVAKNNIKMGQLLKASDLKTISQDVTYLKTAYLNDINKAVGWVGRRLFKRGHVIDESLLKKPLAIRYGQPIKIEIQEGSLTLMMNGKSRGAGAVGDQIPVYIPRTRKKLTAKIINESTVRVE